MDLEGQYQEQAAQKMNVSRSTLQRIVSEARAKVVQALTEGAALRIEGGTFQVPTRYWQCGDCEHTWEIERGSGQSKPAQCPQCSGHAIRLRRTRKHQAQLHKTG